jgi:hypothetical protein
MQIKVADLMIASPLDIQTPIRAIGGNVNLYYMILGRLESMTIHTNMNIMAAAVESEDY